MKLQMFYPPRILGIAALLFLVSATTGQGAAVKVNTLSLGVVFEGAAEPVEAHFRDFVGYVARKLASTPDAKGVVVIAPTALQMAKLLDEGRVDFYMESPYATYVINRQGSATLLLRRWKSGMGEYRGILFSGKGNGITRLDELRGKIIAFEGPGSTSAYFLPKLALLRKGFTLRELPAIEAKVSRNEIGYVFANSVRNIVDWVLSKKVAAGAMSDDDYSTLDEKKKADIAILQQTEPFPRHLVSVRKDLDPLIAKRLKDILLSLHQDDEGRRIIANMDKTTKFDLLPGGEETVRRRLMELYRPRGRPQR